MTDRQVEEYERLDLMVDQAHDNLTAAMMELAMMEIGKVEPVRMYVERVDKMVEWIKDLKERLEDAKNNIKLFIAAIA